MYKSRLNALSGYAALVSLAGAGLFAAIPLLTASPQVATFGPAFWLLAAFVAVAELFPLRTPREESGGQIEAVSAFAFAMLLSLGLIPAMATLAAASAIGDAARGRSWWRVIFNAAHRTTAIVAAGAVLTSLGQTPAFGGPVQLAAAALPGVVGAAVAFFAVNLVLTTVATALREGLTVVQTFGRDLGFHTLTGAVLLSLGTIVAAVAQLNLTLVPLILVPLAAVYKSQSVYLAAEHQALHDPLTGLPNRALFRDRVQQAIFATQRTGQPSAVIWIDLDRFKEVNDTLGHSTGDRLLVEMAARLTDTLRDSDTIARLGGDEFGVVLRGVANHVVAEHVADKLQAAIARPFVFDELVVTVESSFGLALAPDHGQDAETLVGRADSAMFVAKRSRSHRETYMPEHDRDAAERLTLLTGLRQAMESDELVVHYQPKIELGTGSIDGVEALVRWASPHRGLVAPDQFIPQAEQTAVIRRLSRAVLDKALGQVAWWHRRGVSVPVAVNLSTRDVQDPALPGEIAELLAKWLLGPQWLELEITESAVMADPTRTLEVLSRLHGAGVSLTIDDFGIGNTSLAKLNRLPVDTLKIDKSFVSTMATDAGDAAIVRTTCDLGHSLGLWVVAEGVESQIALRQLQTLECDAAQGFYLGRPLPPEELDEGLLHGECLDVIELTGDEATLHPAAGEAGEDQQDNQQSDVPSRTALTP